MGSGTVQIDAAATLNTAGTGTTGLGEGGWNIVSGGAVLWTSRSFDSTDTTFTNNAGATLPPRESRLGFTHAGADSYGTTGGFIRFHRLLGAVTASATAIGTTMSCAGGGCVTVAPC